LRAGLYALVVVISIPFAIASPDLAPEDLLHHLVGPAADRAEARVAKRALDPVFPHVPVAAMDLHALGGDLDHGPLGEQLRHRHLANRVVPVREQAQGVVGERPRRLDLRRHLGELVADRLEAADRPPERLALLRVVERHLEHPLHPPYRGQRHQQPLPCEVGHDQVEAAVAPRT
jgi:hypothetical protein